MKTCMEMEILEQPRAIGQMIDKYVKNYAVVLDMPLIVRDIKIIASGSSYNCGLIAKHFFEKIAHISADVEFSGEFLCSEYKKVDPGALYFFISQSGETTDTVRACEKVKEGGAKTFAVINNSDSQLYNMCDYKINIEAGEEKSIAATKSFSATLCALYLCAVKIGQNKLKDVTPYLKDIKNVEKNIASVLDLTLNLDKAADFLSKYKSFPIVGQCMNYAIAREGALKMKETSFIDVNAFSMGEFLHGYVAVLNKVDTLIEIVTSDMSEFETKTVNKIFCDYKPKSVLITDGEEYFDSKIAVVFPYFEDYFTKTISIVLVLQMLALKVAIKLKRNVDSPEGLSKVVR